MDQPKECGDWVQVSVLGSGAFGTVMLWINRKKNDFVAIKKCKLQNPSALTSKQRTRWEMEVDFLKSVNHSNIIKYKPLDPELEKMINKFNPTKLPLLSMEYCEKGNLRRYLTSEPLKLCGLCEQDVRFILNDICCGLNYLHNKQITHRDIKPENIVLQPYPARKGQILYKIIDLGYAKELQDATLSFVGTLQYLAPEIFYNNEYDKTVDYWSMGIMVFEIICGILPFVPELTPFERYEKIKKKGPDDISIYRIYSGTLANSADLKRENFVTSCFKQNIEAWLRRVLQFEASNRTFRNGLSAFQYLQFILDKKILKVFSIYKLEFYSYEINESTLLGTLKDWVSRDIKVPKMNLLLIFCFKETPESEETIWIADKDEALVTMLLHNYDIADITVYAFKKDGLICDNQNLAFPNLIKELFNLNSTFEKNYSVPLYRQTLFYVYSENRSIDQLKIALFCFVRHIENLCDNIKNNYLKASAQLGELLSKVASFITEKKNTNIDLKGNLEVTDCLKYWERLLSSLERRENHLKEFKKQYKIMQLMKSKIPDARKDLEKLFAQCKIKDLLQIINSKAFLENSKGGDILNKIKDVANQTLKLKFELVIKNKKLKDYCNDLVKLQWSSEELLNWLNNFNVNVEQLLVDVVAVEERYVNVVTEAVKKKRESKLSFNQDESLNIIRENKLLRCQLEDVLSQSFLAHKTFAEETINLLDKE